MTATARMDNHEIFSITANTKVSTVAETCNHLSVVIKCGEEVLSQRFLLDTRVFTLNTFYALRYVKPMKVSV